MSACRFATLTMGALLLASCEHAGRRTPEPVIVTKEVAKPVAVSCVPSSLKSEPVYPDTDEALRAADSERFLQLVLSGRDLRSARLRETEPVIKGCRPSPQ